VVRNFQSEISFSASVTQGIEAALSIWRAGGAEVRDVELPSLDDYWACSFVLLTAEAFAVHERELRERFVEYSESTRSYFSVGGLLSAADYVHARRRRRELIAATELACTNVDLLVTASLPAEAPRTDGFKKWDMLKGGGLCQPFNLTGWPAISLCSGFGAEGLPVSLQLIAKPFEEVKLLQAAFAYEAATSWREARPLFGRS
jgi:aspartyl-tRNA(Asn)/glutamyl-tRNA(Gln) amidotransferase subunit A